MRRIGSVLRRVLFWIALASTTVTLSGCSWLTAALTVVFLSADDDVVPQLRIDELRVVPDPKEASRATDLRRVRIEFRLVGDGEPVEVRLAFVDRPGGGFQSATFSSGDDAPGLSANLPTSPAGVVHEVVWDAESHGFEGFQREVSLQVTALKSGLGVVSELTEGDSVSLGNTEPRVQNIDLTLGDPLVASGSVDVALDLVDSESDPSSVVLFYRTPEMSESLPVPVEHIDGRVAALDTSANGSSALVTWRSDETLPFVNVRDVELSVEIQNDGLDYRGAGSTASSALFCLENSRRPEVELTAGDLASVEAEIPIAFSV
ncbi:MAG: hypothetical protein AAF517_19245, partial [Planctomycetota bacterium]